MYITIASRNHGLLTDRRARSRSVLHAPGARRIACRHASTYRASSNDLVRVRTLALRQRDQDPHGLLRVETGLLWWQRIARDVVESPTPCYLCDSCDSEQTSVDQSQESQQ
jgi:hypothetical protein